MLSLYLFELFLCVLAELFNGQPKNEQVTFEVIFFNVIAKQTLIQNAKLKMLQFDVSKQRKGLGVTRIIHIY